MSRGSDVFAPLFVPLGCLLRLSVAACTGSGDRFTGSPAKLPAEAGRAVWPLGPVNGPASGTAWAESNVSVRLRNWVYTVPVYFWGAVSIVLLIAVAWYAVQHFPAKWIGCLVKIGCALSVFAVFLVGFFYLVLITRTEEVGTWQGQQVVMQKYSFRDATYSYYRYNGPFLLGESLGWSEIPWDIPEYR